MLPEVVHGLEDQSTAHASLNDSSASAVRSFLPTDTASANNTGITSPTDGTVAEPIRTSQAVLVADMPIQLKVELTDRAGNNTAETRPITTVETCTVPANQVVKAQKIIVDAARADEAEQN
jgi:hypothetical protein